MDTIGISDTETNRGIRLKFLFFIGFLAIIFSFNLGYGLYAFFRISVLSNTILERELPLSQGVQESFSAMLSGRFVFGEAMGLDDFSDINNINKLESNLRSSMLIFDSYIAAFTWGSESEAFKKSDGGLNFTEWQRLGLKSRLTIETPSTNQMQLAGISDIYFGGFSINAIKAISNHKKFLRLKHGGSDALAKEAQKISLKHTAKAKNFFNLAINTLSLMVKDSNVTTSKNLEIIKNTQKSLFFNVFIVLVFGFIVSVSVVWIYAKKTKNMIDELDIASKLLVRRDREFSFTNLELISRNYELNEMAKILIGRDLELSHSNEKLLDLDELKSKFVATAAHQLRTPLTALKWSLNELQEGDFGKLKKEQEKLIGDMIAANNRLISLIDDLLDVSRLEEGRETFEMTKQDVVLILKEVCNNFRKPADEKGIKISLEVQMPILLLTFDKEKLTIAISNLVDNAIKYTLPGGQVLIKMIAKIKETEISISDTGIGIPKDQASHVFNRFFRAHNAIILESYGSGLGLSVAREIVEKHDGSIVFTSEEGKGSVFTVILPMV